MLRAGLYAGLGSFGIAEMNGGSSETFGGGGGPGSCVGLSRGPNGRSAGLDGGEAVNSFSVPDVP